MVVSAVATVGANYEFVGAMHLGRVVMQIPILFIHGHTVHLYIRTGSLFDQSPPVTQCTSDTPHYAPLRGIRISVCRDELHNVNLMFWCHMKRLYISQSTFLSVIMLVPSLNIPPLHLSAAYHMCIRKMTLVKQQAINCKQRFIA